MAKDIGYTFTIDGLRKLGIKKIHQQTVRNILKAEGIEPGPNPTWGNFKNRQA